MVVVVTPSTVMETSLTTVLAEPLPPPPLLPDAACEDDPDCDDDEVDDEESDEDADVEDVVWGWDVVIGVVSDEVELIVMVSSLEDIEKRSLSAILPIFNGDSLRSRRTRPRSLVSDCFDCRLWKHDAIVRAHWLRPSSLVGGSGRS